ncbi:hypothetical protein SAMN03159300_10547 [Janthinobacterium sp. 344]|nr:hypothetical protein SAMN03159349_01694 [Janthinobacterium sp. 551a]SFB45671.1 hypothetical protein SAMN03159300_10547 [Janthinobacterium sp. 344]
MQDDRHLTSAPPPERPARATYDDATTRVCQAYPNVIADGALTNVVY